MLDKLEIGYISSTHGLKGEVNVYPTTDDPLRFRDLEYVLVRSGNREVRMDVERVAFFKGKPILKLAGIERIEEAAKLRDAVLLVPREEAIPLDEGEYFIGDLIGSSVLLEDGSLYGRLKDIIRTGANDVYVIEKQEDGTAAYIPAVRELVLSVDAKQQKIIIRVMKEI